MMNDYKIKNILESLKEEVENGKVSLREAAVELHKAGWTNFIDIDATRNLLKTRNVTGNGNVPGVSDMMGKYREMKAAHPDALYIFRNGESCELYEDDAIAASGNKNKHERMDAFDAIREEFKAQFSEEELAEKAALIDRYYHDVEKEAMRRSILDEGKRLDGRKTDEIRPIWSEINCLPGPHGSAIFTRGETQSLSTVTLGTKLDEKIIDNVLEHGKERFLLHYNFPPFSTGEAKAQRGVGRREVGHGHLAWRALKGQIPADYPYVCLLYTSPSPRD